MSSTIVATATATATLATAIPSGTISALIGEPPATEKDYWIVKYLLLSFGMDTDPLLGITIPPSRPTPYHFETKGPAIITSMSIGIAFMVVITSLRLSIRVFRRGLLVGLDDLFIIPGLLLAVTWPALQIAAATHGGAGKHIYDVTYEEYGVFKTCTNLSKVMFFLAVGFVKVSICFFNRRLTSLTGRAWTIFNNVFLFLLFVFILLSLFWNIFQCRPAYGGWDPIRIAKENRRAVCQPDTVVGSTLSVIHVIMDFALLSVPVIVLWKVKMGFKTKLRLYFVFCIGGMSAIGSIMRQIEQGKLSSDTTYTFVPLQDWTLIDLTFGVIAASLPVLSAFIPQQWRSVNGSGSPSTYGFGRSYGANHQPNNANRASYLRTTRRTSVSAKISRTDSQENIMRTDEVELTFHKRENMLRDSGLRTPSATASFGSSPGKSRISEQEDSERRKSMEYGQDGIICKTGHSAWIGQAK